ncbi:MAG: amidophosphoribosyltransferase [Fimbriimonadaceae bacterium]|nr:amidophosphoribosyltransferase [Fimbriimonadaceae bacterium]
MTTGPEPEQAPEFSMSDKPAHECGVVGVYAPGRDVARLAFFSLFALQHRGQEAAGIAVSDGTDVVMHKAQGLVSQVFDEAILSRLIGYAAVGHTRYSTTGGASAVNTQPIGCTSLVGDIAVAHNGNLINTVRLRNELEAEGYQFSGTNDSEAIARLYAHHADLGPVEAARATMKRITGAYSVIVLTSRDIVAFRDPLGLRPLIVGEIEGGGYVIASESCAFAPVQAKIIREVGPGEVVVINEKGIRFEQGVESPRRAMCLFEFIYFARPDSVIMDELIYSTRLRMGEQLAVEYAVDADAVVPVPDSGFPAAIGYSRKSGIPLVEGLIKSRYIHRTFIQPDPEMRKLGVRLKLSPLKEQIAGKRLVLVDDSIVRSTTMGQIVRLLKDSGAKEVHVRITSPPIISPCYYGIDMPTKEELAAATRTVDEIQIQIGADSLGYLSLPSTTRAVGPETGQFCTACFTGDYPLPVAEAMAKHALEPEHRVGDMDAVASGQLKLIN